MSSKRNVSSAASTSRRGIVRRKVAAAAAAAVSVALIVSGCAATDSGGGSESDVLVSDDLRTLFPIDDNSGAGETFPIGMLLAMTGQGAFYGKVMSQGAELAAEQIEAMGGPKFDIKIADHESGDVDAGVSGTRRLIQQDQIEALQTSYGAVTVAILPLIQQSNVIAFNGGGPEPAQVDQDWLYMTRMFAGDDQAAGGLAWLADAYPDITKLAVVGTSENATQSQDEIIPTMWPKLGDGREVVVTDSTEPGATDYSQTVARIQSSGTEAVFTFNTGNDHAYLLKDLRNGGFTGPVIGIEYSTDAATVAGDAYNGYFFTSDFFDVNSPNKFAQQFVAAYRQKYGEDPELYAANYYEEVFMMWELVKRAIAAGEDPHDATTWRDALEKDPTFLSVYGGTADEVGKITINDDHTTLKPQGVYQVVDGAPVELAETRKIDLDADPKTALVSVVKDPEAAG